MAKRTTPVAAEPISPEAAAANALDHLIYNTYGDIRLTERRRDDALDGIRKNAAYLATRYAEIAERAVTGASPSSFDRSYYGSVSERLAEAELDYRAKSELLTEQRRLLKRLLACSTVPQPDQITNAAAL
jgi:hypothetical protein